MGRSSGASYSVRLRAAPFRSRTFTPWSSRASAIWLRHRIIRTLCWRICLACHRSCRICGGGTYHWLRSAAARISPPNQAVHPARIRRGQSTVSGPMSDAGPWAACMHRASRTRVRRRRRPSKAVGPTGLSLASYIAIQPVFRKTARNRCDSTKSQVVSMSPAVSR